MSGRPANSSGEMAHLFVDSDRKRSVSIDDEPTSSVVNFRLPSSLSNPSGGWQPISTNATTPSPMATSPPITQSSVSSVSSSSVAVGVGRNSGVGREVSSGGGIQRYPSLPRPQSLPVLNSSVVTPSSMSSGAIATPPSTGGIPSKPTPTLTTSLMMDSSSPPRHSSLVTPERRSIGSYIPPITLGGSMIPIPSSSPISPSSSTSMHNAVAPALPPVAPSSEIKPPVVRMPTSAPVVVPHTVGATSSGTGADTVIRFDTKYEPDYGYAPSARLERRTSDNQYGLPQASTFRPSQGDFGLACSGGGIRSAAFSSGVLCRLLQQVCYATLFHMPSILMRCSVGVGGYGIDGFDQ
jgi:hypothetical protein